MEVSKLSFSPEYGPKLKEDYIMVKHLPKIVKEDDSKKCFLCLWFGCCNDNWQKVMGFFLPKLVLCLGFRCVSIDQPSWIGCMSSSSLLPPLVCVLSMSCFSYVLISFTYCVLYTRLISYVEETVNMGVFWFPLLCFLKKWVIIN